MNKNIFLVTLLMFIFSMNFISAELTHKQNTELEYVMNSNFADYCTLTKVKTPSTFYSINQNGTKVSQTFNFTLGESNFSEVGKYKLYVDCYDSSASVSNYEEFEVTPNGKTVEGVGEISVGIIYFFLAIGFGFIFLGYLLLDSKSIFVSYSGLVLMLLGSAFLYYDFHLTNLYASTIAYASGADNVTGGAFLIIVRFIKLAPYIIAGAVGFGAVKILKNAKKNKQSSDGWDENNY